MVSGSQLQVAKLTQMCPAVSSSAQRRPAAPRSAQRRPGSKTLVKNPGQKPRSKTWVKTQVKTRGA